MSTVNVNHNYSVEFAIIQPDGTSTIIPDSVTAIHIKKNFVDEIFPLFVLDLSLYIENLKTLVEEDCTVSLTINRFNKYDDSNTESTDYTYDKQCFSSILRIYDKQYIDIDSFTSDVDSDTEETTETRKVSYQINCLIDDLVTINDEILTDVYCNTDITAIIVNLLSNVYNKDAYIQQADNLTRYTNVIVPPMNLNNALNYLSDKYGIYNGTINKFFDANCVYIYDITNNSIQDKSYTINVLTSKQNTDSEIYSTYRMDDNENVTLYTRTSPSVIFNTNVNDYDIGSNIVINRYDENIQLSSTSSIHDNSSSKTRYYWNTGKYETSDNLTNTITAIGSTVVSNVDFSLFEPNTKIIINGSQDNDINGYYEILSAITTISTSDYSTYVSATNITFGKKVIA